MFAAVLTLAAVLVADNLLVGMTRPAQSAPSARLWVVPGEAATTTGAARTVLASEPLSTERWKPVTFQLRRLSSARSEEIRISRGFTRQGAEAQRALAFVLFAAGATFSGNPASASSLNGEGPFAANFVGYAEAGIPPLETVSGRSIGIVNSTLTSMNAENAPYLDNRTGRCLGTWEIDPVSSTFEEHVHCTDTDDDGDRIFEPADFDRQALG